MGPEGIGLKADQQGVLDPPVQIQRLRLRKLQPAEVELEETAGPDSRQADPALPGLQAFAAPVEMGGGEIDRLLKAVLLLEVAGDLQLWAGISNGRPG
ncbi:hypothetical protein [Cyanobium sp. CH-040]|uniref:hypothetical protein n=1 Tax=Cyanobium sp. CH-040 TaxID=2823708 RepID=UPI0020CEA916|nr:hypothetical protein [Cyanobium sp. CH-040]MCP9928824.1 hypothetical protein [Cyanobium sp. CH-040]